MQHPRTLFLLLGTLAINATYASDDYVFSYSTAPYVPLTDPIVVVTNAEFDGSYRYVPIGFDFVYWGMGQTGFTFNTHGYCAFGLSPNYVSIPSTSAWSASAIRRWVMCRTCPAGRAMVS